MNRRNELHLRLQAFGVAEASAIPSGASLNLGMKAMGLVIYLAENAPKPVTRDTLVDLLWERVAPAQGKGSLRQELRRIKRALGAEAFDAVFQVTDNHIAIAACAVDYDAAAARAAAASDDPSVIAGILDLDRGDFLANNSARSEPFQQWVTERREHLKDMQIAALARLGQCDLDAARIDRAQAVADRLIEADPLHEKGHEVLIRCHLASGRRGQARAHFERMRSLMLRELAAEPAAEVAALVTPVPPTQAAPVATPPIGRDPILNKARPTIAVLDVSAPGGGEQAYLAAGVAEQLVANLSKSSWIKVAALNGAPFSSSTPDVDRAQRDIRGYADYVLRVDVRVVDDRVAITATLNRITDNETVFSSQMEDRFDDLLNLQRVVALRIASIFEPVILDDQAEKIAIEWDDDEPDDLDHWRLLMRARWLFWTTTPKNNARARELLKRALEVTPKDAATHCVLAFVHMLDAWSDWKADIGDSVAEARRWAGRAVRISPNDGWAHFTLGVVSSSHDRLEEAANQVSHALKLSPSLVIALGELGRLKTFAGDVAQGRSLAEQALAQSPYDQQAGLWIRTKSIGAWIEEDHAEALDLIDYGLIVRPGWFQNHFLRAAILSETGRRAEAAAALIKGREMVGPYSEPALRIAHPFSDAALYQRFVRALNDIGGGYQKT